MLNNYDFACAAECAQEFEGLMPKAIEALGGIGSVSGSTGVSVFAQGEGVSPLEVIDIEGLAASTGSTI